MVAVNIKSRDHGMERVVASAGSLRRGVIAKVGVQGPKADEERDGVTNAVIAAIHEFGIGVPERSFIRGWVDENGPQIADRLRAVAASVMFGGGDADKQMKQFGEWAVGQIKARIIAHIEPPLTAETIARKGSDTPLVDSGQLISSITSQVERP